VGLGHIKQTGKPLHPAKLRSIGIDAATAPAGVEMDAPAIGTHHGAIDAALLGAEHLQGLRALVWV